MSDMIELDSAWIAANPLPVHGDGTTKDSRGHVIVIGGGRSVPGAPRLTAEAALRAGAGKVQIATIASAVTAMGVALPECGMIALDENMAGEIGDAEAPTLAEALKRCDVVVLGPGMADQDAAVRLIGTIAHAAPGCTLILDAVAIGCASDPAVLSAFPGPVVITPHHGEMAGLLDWDIARIGRNPAAAAHEAVARHGATIVLKGSDTLIATPGQGLLHYPGGGVGLATGGSGDVLAGAIAGLIARGAAPTAAAGWGVWLHGQAARRAAGDPGPIGFLARELLPQIPKLMPQ